MSGDLSDTHHDEIMMSHTSTNMCPPEFTPLDESLTHSLLGASLSVSPTLARPLLPPTPSSSSPTPASECTCEKKNQHSKYKY